MIAGSQAHTAEILRERYRNNRGRRCEVCGRRLAYDREAPYCSAHDKPRVLRGGRKTGRPVPGLRRILDSRKMASWELSEASGVSRRFVEDLRAGRKNASEECAAVLAGALGVEAVELYA